MQDSIGNTVGNWEQVGEVIVPRQTQESLVPVEMTQQKVSKPVNPQLWQLRNAGVDSVAKAREDSIVRAVNDSLAHIQSGYGIVLEDPYYVAQSESYAASNVKGVSGGGLSWVFVLLGILFCLVCFKSRNNSKYFKQLLRDLNETRLRHNMFDNTVRESSFMAILNLLWMASAGVLLWAGVKLFFAYRLDSVPSVSPMIGIFTCMGVAFVYEILMLGAYWITGNIFSDSATTKEWIKGANAATALESLALFPLALVALCYPDGSLVVVEIGGVLFIIGKLLFIYKGFRIFLSQISSLLLFLYYFCSLEVIPLIFVFAGAVKLIQLLG